MTLKHSYTDLGIRALLSKIIHFQPAYKSTATLYAHRLKRANTVAYFPPLASRKKRVQVNVITDPALTWRHPRCPRVGARAPPRPWRASSPRQPTTWPERRSSSSRRLIWWGSRPGACRTPRGSDLRRYPWADCSAASTTAAGTFVICTARGASCTSPWRCSRGRSLSAGWWWCPSPRSSRLSSRSPRYGPDLWVNEAEWGC